MLMVQAWAQQYSKIVTANDASSIGIQARRAGLQRHLRHPRTRNQRDVKLLSIQTTKWRNKQ